MVNDNGGFGRVEFRADDPTLTAHAGLELSGELIRRVRLVERIDESVASIRWPGPVKQRKRGLGVGELVVSVAESMLCGAECWDDLEELRADIASAPFRAVAGGPSVSPLTPPLLRMKGVRGETDLGLGERVGGSGCG